MRGTIAVAAAVLLMGACGDDDDAASVDASVPIDASAPDARPPDGGPECTSFLDCTDPLKLECDVDAGACVQCLISDHCDLYFFTHVCDEPNRSCVECLNTTDCEADPTALGPACDAARNVCTCSGPLGCTNNPNGSICDVDLSACSCATTADCPAGKACEPSEYLGDGKRTCIDT